MRAKNILRKIGRALGINVDGGLDESGSRERTRTIVDEIENLTHTTDCAIQDAKSIQERLTYLEKRYAEKERDLKSVQDGLLMAASERDILVRELQEAREDATCCRKRVEDVKRQLVESENTVNRIASLLKSKDLHQWAFTFLDRVRHPLVAEVYDLLQRAEMTEAKLKACQEANANINANCQRQIAEAKEPELTANQTEILLGIDKATEANVLRTTANNLAKKLFYLEKRYKDAAKTEREACADLIESSSSFILPDHDPDSWIKQFANTIRNRT